jgi:hypothetical protein
VECQLVTKIVHACKKQKVLRTWRAWRWGASCIQQLVIFKLFCMPDTDTACGGTVLRTAYCVLLVHTTAAFRRRERSSGSEFQTADSTTIILQDPDEFCAGSCNVDGGGEARFWKVESARPLGEGCGARSWLAGRGRSRAGGAGAEGVQWWNLLWGCICIAPLLRSVFYVSHLLCTLCLTFLSFSAAIQCSQSAANTARWRIMPGQ